MNTAGTSPCSDDSDSDGMTDGWEINYSLNPLDSSDALDDGDSDTLTNLEEFGYDSNPNDEDTDGDGFRDDCEIDELTDVNDSLDAPTVTLTFVEHEMSYHYSTDASTWIVNYVGYYDSSTLITADLTTTGSDDDFWMVFLQADYDGAFGIEYNEDQFVGTVESYYCGGYDKTSIWYPVATDCTSLGTEASSFSDFDADVSSDLSSYYSFSDFDQWYIPTTSAYVNSVPAYMVVLTP